MMDVRRFVRRLLRPTASDEVDETTVARAVADPSFPYLVSFPRTGSHWLRMIMELTFGEPSLVRTFFHHDADSFTCLHTHDLDLTVERGRVIYLHRDPVETIYSQLSYHELDRDSEIFVRYWANIYGLHLRKWLLDETFTKEKVIVRYEELRNEPVVPLRRIADLVGRSFDPGDLESALETVSKEQLERKTRHDPKVVDRSEEYTRRRQEFAATQGPLVMRCIGEQDERLPGMLTEQ